MTTNANLPIARTDANGTTWYPATPFGWTSNVALAAPHVLAMDANACIVVPADLAPIVETIPFVDTPAARVKGSHAACSHESSKAARAACRKARA